MSTQLLMARAITQTFEVVFGEPNRIAVPAYTDNDIVLRIEVVDTAGAAVDISTYTTRNFGVFPMDSGTADFSVTPAFLTDGTDGIMTVTITDAQTSAFVTADKRIELQISLVSSKVTLLTGVINFVKSWI